MATERFRWTKQVEDSYDDRKAEAVKDPLGAENRLASLRHAISDSADSSTQLLLDLAQRPVFKSLLNWLLKSDEDLAQIAELSYSHVLGFDKIVIMSHPPFGRLRLHVWWPGTARIVEHPHNHRYASHSALVLGKLRTNTYIQTAIGEFTTQYREESAPRENRWSFSEIGPAYLSKATVSEFVPGDDYRMSADTIHQVEAPSELTVTLFLEEQRARDWSEVFVRPGDPHPRSVPQRAFTVSQLRDRLVALRIVERSTGLTMA